jgi:hypothetical protein
MPLTVIERAKAGLVKHGTMLDAYRAEVPRGLLAVWITREAGWDRLITSQDRVLIEAGNSQIPFARARDLDCDPFDLETGFYLAGREAVEDCRKMQLRPWLAEWVTPPGRALLWCVQMPYSIGDGALNRVLSCSIARAVAQGHDPKTFGLLPAVLDWLAVADLDSPHHKRFWGRQSGDVIRERCLKHMRWLDEAQQVDPLDGMPGGEPPMVRPSRLLPFPRELVHEADVCALGDDATKEQHQRAWESVRAYCAKRRKLESAKPAPIVHRVVTRLRPMAYRRRMGDAVA